MTPDSAEELVKVTLEGGPLDGERMTCSRKDRTLNALAVKDANGTYVDPRVWAKRHGFDIPEDAPPQQWPRQVVEVTLPVEYLIDHDHGSGHFREPAVIREQSNKPPEGEWAPADPRQGQEPRYIAWKAAAKALDPLDLTDPDLCDHPAKCTTLAMHLGLVVVDAIRADGLRIVEPTRITGGATALAYLIHSAYERLAPEFGWETQAETRVPWPLVPEANRNLMIATAREVIGTLDMEGRVVTVRIPESAPPEVMDGFEALGNVLRAEAGASLLLALPEALGLTLEALGEDEMREAGWVRAGTVGGGPGQPPPT